MSDRYVTVKEIATRLKISSKAVRRAIVTGELEALRFPGTKTGYRITEDAVESWLASLRSTPTAVPSEIVQ